MYVDRGVAFESVATTALRGRPRHEGAFALQQCAKLLYLATFRFFLEVHVVSMPGVFPRLKYPLASGLLQKNPSSMD